MARSSAMRTEVDEDIKAVRAAPMSKAAASPFVVGSAMAAAAPGQSRTGTVGEESVEIQVWSFSCIWGENSSAYGASEAVDGISKTQAVVVFGGFEGA